MSDIREQAARLYAEGGTYKGIALELDVSPTTIHRWLDSEYDQRQARQSREAKRRRAGTCVDCGAATRYDGVDVAARCPNCAHVASRTIPHEEIVRLRRDEGLSQAAIADRVGCAQTMVSYVLRRNGLGVGKGSGPGRGPRLRSAA